MAPIEAPIKPRILINGNTSISCNDINNNNVQQFDLEVEYTEAFSTESYRIVENAYNPIIPFDQVSIVGEKLNFKNENEFADKAITFFPFGFMERAYNQLAVGENGVVSFNVQNVGNINLRQPAMDIPSKTYPTLNSIFAAHTDLVFDKNNPNAGVYYSIIGQEPARKLVITYLNAQLFDCSSSHRVTSQIVLEETTNAIQIHIKEKGLNCGGNINKSALIGIINKDGSKGQAVRGRNYSDGNWRTKNEGYQFIPNGINGPKIEWYEGSYSEDKPILGTDPKLTVNASPKDIHYTVRITYPNGITLSDDIQISEFLPEVNDISIYACSNIIDLHTLENQFSVNDPSNLKIEYYKDASYKSLITNPHQYSFNNGDIVYVKAMNPSDNKCFDESKITLYFNNYPVPEEVIICDEDDNDIEPNYLLSNLDKKIFGNLSAFKVLYYDSKTATEPITNKDITSGSSIYLEIIKDACRSARLGPIRFKSADIPAITPPTNGLSLEVCDINFNYLEPLTGYSSWKELLIAKNILSNTDLDVSVFLSRKDAENHSNQLTQVKLNINDKSYNIANNSIQDIYYIKVQNDAGCYEIYELPIYIRFYGVRANSSTHFLCKTDASVDVDLSCMAESMFIEMYDQNGNHYESFNKAKDKIKITYHESAGSANNGKSNGISPNQKVAVGNGKDKIFYVRYELCSNCNDGKACYTVKPIIFKPVETELKTKLVEVCRIEENKPQTIKNLAQFNNQLIDNPTQYKILYFKSENDSKDNSKAIKEYTFTGNDNLWVKVIRKTPSSNSHCIPSSQGNLCEQTHKVNFKLGSQIDPIDFPPIVRNNVCDNNNDLREEFDLTTLKKDIYDGDATITFYRKFNTEDYVLSSLIRNPETFMIVGDQNESANSARNIIFAKVDYKGNACFTVVKLDITLNFKNPIITKQGFLCSCIPNPGNFATFNLTEAVNQMFDENTNNANGNSFSNINIQYFKSTEDLADNKNEIAFPESFESKFGEHPIYVKFTNKLTGCFNTEILTLKNLVQPIPVTGEYKYCDYNLNGSPDVLLRDLDNVVMKNNTTNYYFNYYWSKEDAENNKNPILGNSYNPYDKSQDISNTFYEFNNNTATQIWVKVESNDGTCLDIQGTENHCDGINSVQLIPGEPIKLNKTSYTLEPVCDTFEDTGLIDEPTYNDGISDGIDLTPYEKAIESSIQSPITIEKILYYKSIKDIQNETYPFGQNAIPDEELTNFTNIDANGEALDIVYAKIKTSAYGWCPELVELNMNIIQGPTLKPQPNYYLCPG
ncbi:MAG: hypothetical protein ACR2MS_13145 [Weeksellaceae bacterium]